MSYDETLASRCREVLAGQAGLSQKKMFGGLSFLIEGKMACGVLGERLVIKLDPGPDYDRALGRPHVSPMDFTGRPMRGFVYVARPGLEGAGLEEWLAIAVRHARATRPKKARKSKVARTRKKARSRRAN